MERFQDITELLEQLQAQTYRQFEIIVIIDKSEDLYDSLRSHVNDRAYPNTRVFLNRGPLGLSPARNLGIGKSKGDIVAFIDDDALPFPDWVESIVRTHHEEESVIGVTGFAFPLWEDESMQWFPEEFYWIIGCSAFSNMTTVQDVRNVWGANMSFSREAFELSGVFDEENFGSSVSHQKGKRGLIGDDTEFSLRVRRRTGKRIIFNPDVKIWHRVHASRLDMKLIRKYAYRHAYSKAVLRNIYPNYDSGHALAAERALLKRIFFGLIPSTLAGFVKHPTQSWLRLSVTTNVLTFTAFGYAMGNFFGHFEPQEQRQ